jgi:NO-binding membrane sensor protein with MHYT domain
VRHYHRITLVLSVLIALLGVALLAVTAAQGGGTTGFVVGGLFLALGVARFTLERKRPRA